MKWLTRMIQCHTHARRARLFAGSLPPADTDVADLQEGALLKRFRSHVEGAGIWKWEHYFPVYERHLSTFVGRSPVVLEIGIYSGGSLPLWREYFGDGCRIFGVDINPACKAYESDNVSIHIGDQASREFWRDLELPVLDVVIDDGGHLPEQQIVTLEELLPRMARESVYICEDIHGVDNPFTDYVHGLSQSLNATVWTSGSAALNATATQFQRTIASVHTYSFLTVIEKSPSPKEFAAPKRGSSWEPSPWLR